MLRYIHCHLRYTNNKSYYVENSIGKKKQLLCYVFTLLGLPYNINDYNEYVYNYTRPFAMFLYTSMHSSMPRVLVSLFLILHDVTLYQYNNWDEIFHTRFSKTIKLIFDK